MWNRSREMNGRLEPVPPNRVKPRLTNANRTFDSRYMESPLRTIGIFALGIFLGTAGVVGFVLYNKHSTSGTPDAPEVETVKSDTSRVWRDDMPGSERPLHSSSRDSVYRAVALSSYKNTLLIGDYGDMQIKRLSPDGALLRIYRDTTRRGRGGNRHLMGFSVTPSDLLVVQDHRHREMLRFEAGSGKLLSVDSLGYRPYRLASVGDHLVSQAIASDTLFRVYNREGKRISEFGKLKEDQRTEATEIAGDIIPAAEPGRFIFAPSRAGFLVWFDLQGNEIRRVLTPDRNIMREKGIGPLGNVNIMRSRQEGPTIRNVRVYDLDSDGENLYVSMSERDRETGKSSSFADVYELDTGAYLYSFRLPSLANDIVVMEDTLYYLERNTERLRAFRLRSDPS